NEGVAVQTGPSGIEQPNCSAQYANLFEPRKATRNLARRHPRDLGEQGLRSRRIVLHGSQKPTVRRVEFRLNIHAYFPLDMHSLCIVWRFQAQSARILLSCRSIMRPPPE